MTGRDTGTRSRLKAALESAGVRGDILAPEGPEELVRSIEKAAASGRRHIAAAGGDRFVGHVVDALMRQDWTERPVLGLLPGESGCNFAKVFGIPDVLPGSATHLQGAAVYRVDVGRVTGPWGDRFFLNMLRAGTGAGESSRRASFAEVTTDRRTYQLVATDVVVANGQFGPGGLKPAPRASVTDGLLDVQIWNVPRRARARFDQSVARGLHLADRRVRRTTSATVTLALHPPWRVEVDGDVCGETPVWVSLSPQALDVKI